MSSLLRIDNLVRETIDWNSKLLNVGTDAAIIGDCRISRYTVQSIR